MNELIADELAKLAQLRDQGVLTDDEFTARKALLLSRGPASTTPTGLKAFFGCLGLIGIVVIMPQISGIIRGQCVEPSAFPASEAALDAEVAANQAAAAAAEAVDKAARPAK